MITTEKTCFKCKNIKSLSEFYRHASMADGHLNKCKECTKEDVKKHRADNPEKLREFERVRNKRPERRAMQARVYAAWEAAHPERRVAQIVVGNAVRDGKLTQLPCFICGGQAEAHHPDYSSPLDVVWLCPAHHKQLHTEAARYRSAA